MLESETSASYLFRSSEFVSKVKKASLYIVYCEYVLLITFYGWNEVEIDLQSKAYNQKIGIAAGLFKANAYALTCI